MGRSMVMGYGLVRRENVHIPHYRERLRRSDKGWGAGETVMAVVGLVWPYLTATRFDWLSEYRAVRRAARRMAVLVLGPCRMVMGLPPIGTSKR